MEVGFPVHKIEAETLLKFVPWQPITKIFECIVTEIDFGSSEETLETCLNFSTVSLADL